MTLVWLDNQIVGLQAFKHGLDMGEVLCMTLAGHQDVVDVDKGEREYLQDAVHQPLECLSCISQFERHPQELPDPKGIGDCHLLYVIRMHGNLAVALYEINIRKKRISWPARIEIQDVQYGIPVQDRGQVEVVVVTAGPPLTISLGCHVEQGDPLAGGWANDAMVSPGAGTP